MNIPAPVITAGKVLGAAAGVGAATYVAEKALLERTQGTTHEVINHSLQAGGFAGMLAFWMVPGLPAKPIASGVLLGMAGASLLAHEK